MPNPDQSPHQPPAGQPSAGPERAFRSLLAADARPAIRAASGQQLRSVLTGITSHLCRRVHRQVSDFIAAAPAPDRWPGACEAGSGMRAGFQLYDDLCRAVAASWLHAAGFDPAQAAAGPDYHAAVIVPFLAAGKHRLRGVLLTLTDRVRAATADADASAAIAAAARFPDDVWDAGTGVSAAITLYQHAVLTEAAQVTYRLHHGLGTGRAPAPLRFTPPPAGIPFFPASPN